MKFLAIIGILKAGVTVKNVTKELENLMNNLENIKIEYFLPRILIRNMVKDAFHVKKSENIVLLLRIWKNRHPMLENCQIRAIPILFF